MAGTVLAAAILVVAGTGAIGMGMVAGAAGVSQTASGAADNAALAAADVAMGLVSDDPCAVASRIVQATGARLAQCQVSDDSAGVAVTVVVDTRFGAFPVRVTARAGNA